MLFEAFGAALREDGDPDGSPRPSVDRVLAHERRHWQRMLPQMPERRLQLAVAAATIAGAEDNEQARAALIAADPALADAGQGTELASLIKWLATVYPGERLLNPLRPDRLGEALLADVLCRPDIDNRGFVHHDGHLLSRLLALPGDEQIARAVDLLARLTSYHDGVAAMTATAVLARYRDVIPRAEAQTRGTVERPGGNDLAQGLVRLLTGPVAEHLSTADFEHQRGLSVSYNRLGDLAQAAGDTRQAETLYQQSLTIREKLARANPTDVQLQRDLSVSYNRLGDLAEAVGDTDQARAWYERSLPITRLLHQRVPESVGFAGDLAITLSRLASFGSPPGALKAEAGRTLAPFARSGRLTATGERLYRWATEE